MEKDSDLTLSTLQVDGGAVTNTFLMQFQSDILNVPVKRAAVNETTAMGATMLAGLAVGYWKDKEEIKQCMKTGDTFYPQMDEDIRTQNYDGWKQAVEAVCRYHK